MITRPLDLASKLRPPPRNMDALFYVNAGLLVLFFSMFGSRFILAPGLGVDFRLPVSAGANVSARPPTHVISVLNSGQILTTEGDEKLAKLGNWLRTQAIGTKSPLLLVRASAGVTTAMLADIADAARGAGFDVLMAVEDPGVKSPVSAPAK